MVLQRTLYHNAVRIDDEAGKGAEILRQQSFSSVVNGTYVMFIAEVDCIVTSAHVVVITGNPSAGHATVNKRISGSNVPTVVASQTDVDGALHDVYNLTLNGETRIKRGEIVEIAINQLAGSTVRLSIHLGWIPDLWYDDAAPHSYVTE